MDAFITALFELAASCDFGSQADNFIQDQLVAKTNQRSLLERLLLESSTLTLDRTVTIGRSFDAMAQYCRELSLPADVCSIDRTRTQATGAFQPPLPLQSCFRCGTHRQIASSTACRARNKTCRKCGKMGHFEQA